MKYILLIYGAKDSWTEDQRRTCMIDSLVICDELKAQGKYHGASPLQSVTTAACVRVRDGRTLVTDGPFAETSEQLGGYFVLDLADLDEAIAVAGSVPPAAKGTVEIRPLLALDGLPPDRPLPTDTDRSSPTPYLLLFYYDDAAREAAGPEALAEACAEAAALARRLDDEGRYLGASLIHPVLRATCVAVRDGRRIITNGPFAGAHEGLGGYCLILADDRAAAIRLAAQHPVSRVGTVEARPLFDMSGLRKPS